MGSVGLLMGFFKKIRSRHLTVSKNINLPGSGFGGGLPIHLQKSLLTDCKNPFNSSESHVWHEFLSGFSYGFFDFSSETLSNANIRNDPTRDALEG
jgi:hypothetical protein